MGTRTTVALGAVAVCLAASAAYAQEPGAGTHPAQPGQFSVERVESGFVIAPDAKLTQVNDRSATLAGAYGGWMLEHTFLFGAGAYWLTNDSRDFKMAYAGPVFEWLIRGDRQIGFGVRTLVGGGSATIGGTLSDLFGVSAADAESAMRDGHGFDRRGDLRPTGTSRVIAREDFFVAEPQAIVTLRTIKWLHIDAGFGYRVIAGAGSLNDRLRGASGTISIVFGAGGS